MAFPKKSQMAYQEILVIAFSLVLVGISLFMVFNLTGNMKDRVETKAPEISYKYPQIFTYTFLNMKVEKSDIKDDSDLDNFDFTTKNIYYLKDVIQIAGSKSTHLISKYRLKYLELVQSLSSSNKKDSLLLYNNFLNSKIPLKYEDLIKFNFLEIDKFESLPKFDYLIKNNNYAFVIPIVNSNEVMIINFFDINEKYVNKNVVSCSEGYLC